MIIGTVEEISIALVKLRPGAEWTVDERGITWLDVAQSQPTEVAIQAEIDNPTPIVPEVINMVQARIALIKSGYKARVDEIIAAIEDPLQRQIAEARWEYETTVVKSDPLVQYLISQIPLTETQVNELFILAVT